MTTQLDWNWMFGMAVLAAALGFTLRALLPKPVRIRKNPPRR